MNQSTVARLRVNFFLCVLALFTVDSATARAADSIVLPVSMTDNRPMIEATINGEGPFHFIVDTGTSDEAVFSERLVKKLALKPTGESESVDGVTLKAVKVPQYTVALKCAGFAASEVKALAIPFDETDGIVGFSLFQKYLFQLDLAAGRIVLSQGSLPTVNQQTVLSYTDPDGIPMIMARLGGDEERFALDSGQDSGILLPSAVAARLEFKQPPKVVGRVASSQTEFEIKAGDISENLRIGSHTVSQPKVEFADMIREGNLGATIFKQFVVTFDQKNKRVEFAAHKP
jgi:Aspartyl protease